MLPLLGPNTILIGTIMTGTVVVVFVFEGSVPTITKVIGCLVLSVKPPLHWASFVTGLGDTLLGCAKARNSAFGPWVVVVVPAWARATKAESGSANAAISKASAASAKLRIKFLLLKSSPLGPTDARNRVVNGRTNGP